MDMQILRKDRATESGRSLRERMYGKSMKLLDLLVRESIQNSLDAAKERRAKTHVNVDIITGTYNSSELTKHFGNAGSRLQKRYPDEQYGFIAIRDSNTVGLTGDNNPDHDRSNLQKLIYQISKEQEKKGSGGSCGVGKTTFFKIGIGLVIYYSRVKLDSGEYQSRLAATLVEDELDNPIVTEESYRGIAFFGKRESWPNAPSDYTVPITDETMIGRFLSIFGIPAYAGEDTGTTVVMPYANHKDLLANMTATMQPGLRMPVWSDDINECIKILVQRWYSPRLSNSKYDGAWLKASVNGKPINHETMHPVFRLIQDLYNKALYPNEPSEFGDIFVQHQINIASVSGKKAGVLETAIVNSKMFGLTREIYRNIYSYIGTYDDKEGTPIITYVRKPGMIIRYETINSKWVPSITNLDENRILIGLFVLNSNSNAVVTLKDGSKTDLEEYVRSGEENNHYGWNDNSTNNIVGRIAENVKSKVSALLTQKTETSLKKRSRLTDVFSDLFLPSVTYYSTNSSGGGKSGGSSGGTHGHAKKTGSPTKFGIVSNSLLNGKRILISNITFGSRNKCAEYKYILKSETGLISPKDWEEPMDKPYPLKLESFRITQFKRPRGNNTPIEIVADLGKSVNIQSGFTIKVLYSPKYNVPYGICVESDISGVTISCESILSSDTTSISFEPKYSSYGGVQ